MARKGRTKVINKGTFISDWSLVQRNLVGLLDFLGQSLFISDWHFNFSNKANGYGIL